MAGAPSHLELFDNKPRAREVRRQAAAGGAAEGLSRRVHQPELDAAGTEVQLREARTVRGGALRAAPAHRRRSSTTSRSSSRCRPTPSTTRPAQIFMNTGAQQFGRPSIGSWMTYGLGSEVAGPAGLRRVQHRSEGHQRRRRRTGAAASCRRSTRACRSAGRAIRSSTSPTPAASTRMMQRDSLDAITQPERAAPRRGRRSRDRDAHQLVRDGVPHAVERAGADGPLEGITGARSSCTARSRANRRYAQLLPAGAAPGRARRALRPALPRGLGPPRRTRGAGLKEQCKKTDQASAALVMDLKQRGLLEDTLVIWGGEFGRTPMVQGGNDGRDHHPNAFTMWLAGGGVKPGLTLGEHRRARLQRGRGPGPRPRPARDDPAPARLRPHEADLPLPGPRLPPDRRPRRAREKAAGVDFWATQNVLGWPCVPQRGCECTCR